MRTESSKHRDSTGLALPLPRQRRRTVPVARGEPAPQERVVHELRRSAAAAKLAGCANRCNVDGLSPSVEDAKTHIECLKPSAAAALAATATEAAAVRKQHKCSDSICQKRSGGGGGSPQRLSLSASCLPHRRPSSVVSRRSRSSMTACVLLLGRALAVRTRKGERRRHLSDKQRSRARVEPRTARR